MTISISDELKEKIDKYNADTLIPKSSIITLALDQYFQSREIMSQMKDLGPMLEEMKKMTIALEGKKNDGR